MSTTPDTTVTTTLLYADRLKNSTNGNPRFRLHTSDGSFQTMSDAASAYDVESILSHRRSAPLGVLVRLTLTPARRVRDIERRGA
jgi:hypothetical protein